MPYINSIRGNHRGQKRESYPEEIYNITGGDKVYKMGGYKIHMFTTVGEHTLNLNWNEKYAKAMNLQQPVTSITASYLVIAGGGGGGNFSSTNGNGGAGAGGYRTGSATVFGSPSGGSTVPVTVGSPGSPISPSSNSNGGNGGSSIIGSISTVGGGGGASYGANFAGSPGGSGGGPAGPGASAGQGTPGQGNPAPTSGWYYWSGNGGGGSGSGGGTSSPSGYAMDGGRGTSSSITGSAVSRGGGGGGGGNSSEPSGDGYDGGGKGYGTSPRYGYTTYPTSFNPSNQSWGSVNGIPNTGGGGGAGSYWSPNSGAVFASGAGGTGIVVISYPG